MESWVILQEKPEHDHAPDPVGVRVRENLMRLREIPVRERTTKASVAVSRTVGSIASVAVLARMPRTALLRQQVTYNRSKSGTPIPTNPSTAQEIVIPDSMKVIIRPHLGSFLAVSFEILARFSIHRAPITWNSGSCRRSPI